MIRLKNNKVILQAIEAILQRVVTRLRSGEGLQRGTNFGIGTSFDLSHVEQHAVFWARCFKGSREWNGFSRSALGSLAGSTTGWSRRCTILRLSTTFLGCDGSRRGNGGALDL